MIDGRGVLGFPMRLGIAFLIIALFVPSFVSVMESYTEESELSQMRTQADVLVSSAADVWYAGSGSSETVSLNLLSGYELLIGGSGGDAWSYSILKGDAVKEKSYTETPKIRFLGESTQITGHCDVVVTSTVDSNGVYGVEVTFP